MNELFEGITFKESKMTIFDQHPLIALDSDGEVCGIFIKGNGLNVLNTISAVTQIEPDFKTPSELGETKVQSFKFETCDPKDRSKVCYEYITSE